MSLYIYHHLGLGDHIICNAIVRHYAKINDEIFLFVKPHNYDSVSFMYRDLDNIEYIKGDDNYVENFIKDSNINNLIKIGFNELNIKDMKFDRSFYSNVKMSFEKRWIDFFLKRDYIEEDKIYNKFNISEDYVFIHDDESRNFKILEQYIVNKNLRIIKPLNNLTSNIFNYLKILENASEIHCIDSSFKLICDSILLKTDKLFLHLNRNQPLNLYSTSSKKWTEINY